MKEDPLFWLLIDQQPNNGPIHNINIFIWCVLSVDSAFISSPLVGTFCLLVSPRSGNYGSPNSRRRCYLIGVRMDLFDEMGQSRMNAMLNFIKVLCPSVHKRMSLEDCCLDASKHRIESKVSTGSHNHLL